MQSETLPEFAAHYHPLVDIASNDSALLILTYLACNGYMQTPEFSSEFSGRPGTIQRTLSLLVDAGFVAFRRREEGIFTGWVVSERGLAVASVMGFEIQSNAPVDSALQSLIANTLMAQAVSNPNVEDVVAVLECVPEYRQEWLGYAICQELIHRDQLLTLLSPTEGEVEGLRSTTILEIKQIPLLTSPDVSTKPVNSSKSKNFEWSKLG